MGLPAPFADLVRASPWLSGQRVRQVAFRLLGFAVAVTLIFAAWRGYQQPNLLLDLASFRLC
jgi:hypothetical protein